MAICGIFLRGQSVRKSFFGCFLSVFAPIFGGVAAKLDVIYGSVDVS